MPQPPDEAELRRLRHDVRGVLNEMRLCVEALRTETDPHEALQWLAMIERAADRGDALAARLVEAAGEAV
jgi:signal transduction histidine kinase